MKKKNNLINLLRLLFLVATLGISTSHAVSVGLTLTPDKDPLTLTIGEAITFTVGMEPESAITGYTLDIRYDDTELDFVSSEQLVPFFGGAFVPPYVLDPATTAGDAGSSGLASSNSGRASVLNTSDSVLVGNLFSLSFTVRDLFSDGLDDLVVGILDGVADAINPPVSGEAFTINPNVVSAQVGVATVPVPAALWLFGSGLIGLVIITRNRKAV